MARFGGLDAEIAAGAGQVLDIDLLAPCARQPLRHHAADDVGRTAGRKRHDHADFMIRIGVRGTAWCRRQSRHNEARATRRPVGAPRFSRSLRPP